MSGWFLTLVVTVLCGTLTRFLRGYTVRTPLAPQIATRDHPVHHFLRTLDPSGTFARKLHGLRADKPDSHLVHALAWVVHAHVCW